MPDCATGYVWFPLDCLVSMYCISTSGASTEAAAVGREGLIGLFSVVCGCNAVSHAVVQIGGSIGQIPAPTFRRLFDERPALRAACLHYTGTLVARMAQGVLCSSHHPLGARLAGWLVAAQDRTGRDELPMTHEHLAQLLGVQRTTLTQAALALQGCGCIHYHRGMVAIRNRQLLKAKACECYVDPDSSRDVPMSGSCQAKTVAPSVGYPTDAAIGLT